MTGAFLAAEYDHRRTTENHEQRLEYVEATRLTSDNVRQMLSQFVPRSEVEASVTRRLDRIEEKLDRLVESSR